MKKIIFSIFIFAMTACLAFGSAFIIKDWDVLFDSSQIEQPVPDSPGETPEEPEEPEEPVEKVEITDWVFSENVLGQYIGTETEISNIPTSYSQEEHVSRTVEIKNEEEFYSFVEEFSASEFAYQIPIRVTYLNLDLVKTYENFAIFMNDFEVLAVENNVEDLYLCKFEELDNTFYEGSDYKIDTLGAMTFYFSSATAIDLPAEITKFNAIMLPSTLKSLTIRSESVLTRAMNNTLGFDDPVDYTIYVPENLVEGYKTTYPRVADSVFPIGYKEIPYVIENGVITAYTGSETEIVIPATYSLSSEGQAIEGSDYTITEIGDEVFKDSNIYSIDLSNTSILELGVRCFENTSNLSIVILPQTLISLGNYCFNDSNLSNINLQETSISVLPDSCFSGTASLKNIIFPNSLEMLGSTVFYESGIENIDFSNTKLSSIGNHVFQFCKFLQNVVFPSGVHSSLGAIFFDCSSIVNLDLSNLIVDYDPYWTGSFMHFYGMDSLEQLILPFTYSTLKLRVLSASLSLKNITLLSDSIVSIDFSSFTMPENFNFYVPDSLIENYKTTYADYANYFVSLEA